MFRMSISIHIFENCVNNHTFLNLSAGAGLNGTFCRLGASTRSQTPRLTLSSVMAPIHSKT